MIIPDDHSHNANVSIIKFYSEREKRISLIESTKNEGAVVNPKKALRLVQGRFIAFLEGDDIWQAFKLSKLIDFLLSNKIAQPYARFLILMKMVSPKLPDEINYEGLLGNQVIGF